jgi:putative transcriptional regulator
VETLSASPSWLKCTYLAVAMLILPALASHVARSAGDAPSAEHTLAGQLLVASPEIGDPRFAHTVILIVHHDEGGAFGIVINRPVEERSFESLLEAIGDNGKGVEGNVRIFSGGPVQPEVGFVVHSVDYHREDTIDVDGRVAMTSSSEILRDIAHKQGPKQSLVAFGYAGWAPGQLEAELERHDWFTVPEDPKLVFDEDREKLWDLAMARRTLDL